MPSAPTPSTTLWDTASYISALVAAYELCVIDKREFDTRATKLINTLRNLDLYRGEAPNKVYNTETGAKVNYANQAGEVGMSALDIGRMLVWLRILKERHPYLANSVDNVPMRWNFCNLVNEDGGCSARSRREMARRNTFRKGVWAMRNTRRKALRFGGFDTSRAMSPEPVSYIDIYGVKLPFDGRDPRVFKNQNYVLTEGYILDGLEMGWDLPTDRSNDGLTASQGWRAEFANRVYLVQQRRFEQTGIITARSEHQVDGKPYFVYDSIFADGYPWNTLDPTGEYQPDRAAIAAKAAIGLWALWDTKYTDLLFDSVADLSEPDRGFYEGLYENGNGYIPLHTANNNGIILAALLYKVQGPILQQVNTNTQHWNVAFAGTDLRGNKCHPNQMVEVVPCCACETNPDRADHSGRGLRLLPPGRDRRRAWCDRVPPRRAHDCASENPASSPAILPSSCIHRRVEAMTNRSKPRMVWFDANRVFAAMGVVLIHSSTDFNGQPFAKAEVGERIFPVFLRSIGEFSGSEMFFLFSLFLMAMRVDTKLPSYGAAIGLQARRLLIPFAFWVVFYAFFRLIKQMPSATRLYLGTAQPAGELARVFRARKSAVSHALPADALCALPLLPADASRDKIPSLRPHGVFDLRRDEQRASLCLGPRS